MSTSTTVTSSTAASYVIDMFTDAEQPKAIANGTLTENILDGRWDIVGVRVFFFFFVINCEFSKRDFHCVAVVF